MTKKKENKSHKLTDNITYRIMENTIYLLLNSNSISKEELSIVYKKIPLIMEDNDLSYINISGKRLEDNKEYLYYLGFTLSYYDVNKLNALYAGTKDKKEYRCYGIMTKKDFIDRINEEKEPNKENIKITSVDSRGYINSIILLLFGVALLCFFCVQGAIYLVK